MPQSQRKCVCGWEALQKIMTRDECVNGMEKE